MDEWFVTVDPVHWDDQKGYESMGKKWVKTYYEFDEDEFERIAKIAAPDTVYESWDEDIVFIWEREFVAVYDDWDDVFESTGAGSEMFFRRTNG